MVAIQSNSCSKRGCSTDEATTQTSASPSAYGDCVKGDKNAEGMANRKCKDYINVQGGNGGIVLQLTLCRGVFQIVPHAKRTRIS